MLGELIGPRSVIQISLTTAPLRSSPVQSQPQLLRSWLSHQLDATAVEKEALTANRGRNIGSRR